MYVGQKNPRCGCNPRPRESLIASAGPSGQHVLGSQTCRRYSIWKTLAGFRTARGTAVGEYPTRHLVGCRSVFTLKPTAFVIRSGFSRKARVDDPPNSRKLPAAAHSIAARSHSCSSTLGTLWTEKQRGFGADLPHRSMTTSRIGCEQQTRILPSAGLSSGSGP